MSKTFDLLNSLRRQGFQVTTEQRADDWIAFLTNSVTTCEAGATEEEAVEKLYDTIKSWFK